jgi:hypothetical protein
MLHFTELRLSFVSTFALGNSAEFQTGNGYRKPDAGGGTRQRWRRGQRKMTTEPKQEGRQENYNSENQEKARNDDGSKGRSN